MLVMTQPETEGNDANDLKPQSTDSHEDSKDDAQPDCSEMVGFASLRWSCEVYAPDAAVEKRYSTV